MGFDEDADCPKWMAFLQRTSRRHRAYRAAPGVVRLQLLPEPAQQNFYYSTERVNGKSVVCAVLTALLGEATCLTCR